MLRKHIVGFFALLFCIGVLVADEAKGKFKESKFDKDKKALVLTITVGEKDQSFDLTKESKVTKGGEEVKGKERFKTFKELKKGEDEVTVIFEKDGDKVTVKEVKIK